MAANEKIALAQGGERFRPESAEAMEGRNLLTFRLIVLYKLISRQASRHLGKQFDLSMAEWWILAQLGEHSPRTLRQLAEVTYADKAQLSRAGTSLLKKGYVRREPDSRDARSVLFSLTPEGLAIKDAVRPIRRALNQTLLEQLSEEERDVLDSAIETLTEFLLANGDAL